MTFGARALIRLGALKHNLGVVRTAAPNVVHCRELLAMLESYRDGRVKVWLKIDTGMNREASEIVD